MDVDSDGSDEEIPELDVDMSLGPVAGKSSLSARESDSEIESEEAQPSEDDEGDGQDGGKKKGRKAKAFEKKRIENALKEKELDLLEGSAPETADDYERLVVSQPHSSFRWIKYVAYQVGLAQFDKARAVIGRALKAIPATEQQERFNVYVASLNLEHLYGSPESLKQVLVAAAAACEPAKIYTEMAKIYSDNKQHELAKGCYELMLKKFCSANAFVAYATHLSKISAPEEDIKALLNRALERLPKAEHVPLISKFAQLEYKSGVAERGRTMFEGILQSYPKRVDVWSIYLDMEVVALNTLSNSDKKIKQNAVAAIRRVFERTITLPLSSKKMKFFFKRYLTFEQQHGDAASQEHVKEKAREYVLSRA
jgi:rRNA biogenesis protein RRP5